MFYQGINLSGLESYNSATRGKHGFDYRRPDEAHYDYWFGGEGTKATEMTGMNIVRLPVRWERLQNSLYSELDQDYLKLIKEQVAFAASRGADIIIDVHNLARYSMVMSDGTEKDFFIGSKEVPASAFDDLWIKLANEFKDNDNVVFGLMNEPMTNYTGQEWADIAQGTINAIRDTGADNKILVPGIFWSSAKYWNTRGNADALAGITDPENNIIFEAHQYFDKDGSGRSGYVVDDAVSRLYDITQWARETGNQIFLGEFGLSLNNPDTAAYNAKVLSEVLKYMNNNSDVWHGWTAWGGGEFWSEDYHFNLTPQFKNGDVISEQSEALWFKSFVQDYMKHYMYENQFSALSKEGITSELWTNIYQKQQAEIHHEAEDLTLGGHYTIAKNRDASGGKSVLSYGGTGEISVSFDGANGYYQIRTDYFDESDGQSRFRIAVNGKDVHKFNADQNLNNILRDKTNLVSNLSHELYLEKGDKITITGARHRNELAAIDMVSFLGGSEDIHHAGLFLTGLTDSQIFVYDQQQNDGSATIKATSDGRGLAIDGNGWAAIDIDYTFTEDTIVSVNLTVEELGEIHGVGFDTDLKMRDADIFQLAGTQNYGHNLRDDIKLNGGREFTFHAGDYLDGHRTVMSFIGDDDNHRNGLGRGSFDDIRIYELTSVLRGTIEDDILHSTHNAEYMYGGAGADIFELDSSNLDLTDKIMDFSHVEGDKIDVSTLADDLGVNIDLIINNLSLVTDKFGRGTLLFHEGATTGKDGNIQTLALFDKGVAGLSVKDIV